MGHRAARWRAYPGIQELRHKEAQRRMAKLDLNARRAARSEAEKEPHEVELGHDADGNPLVWRLRPQMPVEYTDLLVQGRMAEALRLLLVDEDDWPELRKQVPDDDELTAISELYAVTPPESPASAGSSTSDGTSSRRTSNGSTASTSPTAATAGDELVVDGSLL